MVDLNLKDFITKEHRQVIEAKLMTAIDSLDQSAINAALQEEVISQIHEYSGYWLEDIDYSRSTKALSKKINEIIIQATTKL